MFLRLGSSIARFWPLVIGAWLALAIGVHLAAPRWDDVTNDGDLAYLPDRMTTVRGERLLAQAFPEQKSKSQLVLVAARADSPLTERDRETLQRLAARFGPGGDIAAPVVGIWTPASDVIGAKLVSPDRQAALAVLQLTSEFMTIENMELVKRLDAELRQVQQQADFPAGLQIGLSGSAAVGGDMLDSAAESLKNTEVMTLLLVVTILVLVYRAPVLVLVPLITLGLSFILSTDVLALLTLVKRQPGWEWFDFRVFKTSKIFIVTILFGAGTDFCLFLISRYREELERGHPRREALAIALGQVGHAITASAATTVFGLSMMFFADFGKYRNSGPAIGLCLGIALVACLTLAPALLRAFAWCVFWPGGVRVRPVGSDGAFVLSDAERRSYSHRFWEFVGQAVVTRPGLILVGSVLLLAPLAWTGWHTQVTYNLLAEMSPHRPSVRGTGLLSQHFPAGEMGPITVLAHLPGGQFNSKDGETEIARLTKWFYQIPGVQSVRSVSEPLGDQPGLVNPFSAAGRAKLLARKHRTTRNTYLTQVPNLTGEVTRFDVLLTHDPFSLDALETLELIDDRLQQLAAGQVTPSSEFPAESIAAWRDVEFDFLGTTAATRDLRAVTQSDQRLIQLLVTFSVLGILIVLLRQPVVCVYLIVSVLFSYLVTLGITELAFRAAFTTFHGLDWKVPLFLFVILVAVGEDYNIYLLTRVVEEQQHHGLREGLRRAVVQTGGIITSCGVIMAGTFVSMMGGTLRGMLELGFALTLGVMLDTIIVRPILVPAFLALLYRWTDRGATPGAKGAEPAVTAMSATSDSSATSSVPVGWTAAVPHAIAPPSSGRSSAGRQQRRRS